VIEWLMNLNQAARVGYIVGACLFVVGIGIFLVWWAWRPLRQDSNHRWPARPDVWHRDHTGEFLRPPLAEVPYVHVPAAHMPRHRADDMDKGTTLIDPGKVARARAMLPPGRLGPGEERRSLSPDWRDMYPPEDDA
jgi:hypothetical protein